MSDKALFFIVVGIVLLIIVGIANMPTCGLNEVMVQGTYGMVCIEGHH